MATAPPPKASATTEPAVEKTPPTLKKDRGTVKSVLSGDTLVVLDDKPSTTGPPAEKIITLSSLLAPKLARGDNKEEPFAWESREFLRKKAVGKKIQYAIDHSTGTREYVTAYLAPVAGFDPECINHSVVSEGWAVVHNKDAKRAETLVQLEEAALQAGKGMHAKEKPKPIGKNDEDAETLFRQLKGKPINAIVEQVRTGSSVRVTVLPSRHQFQVLLSGVQCNGWRKKEGEAEPQPEEYAREAKFFVENHVLQRDVTLTIESIAQGQDKQQISFSGSIEFQGHDVAEELLKAGLGRYIAYSAAPRGAEWVAKLKAAEKAAKDNKRRLFAKYEAKSETNGQKGVPSEFTGKVVSVINSGAIAVVPDGQTKDVQINISAIRTPKPGFPGDEEQDARNTDKAKVLADKAERYWAAEGKETLRRRLIGQKVRVVYDYTRKAKEVSGDQKALPEKSFYTVYHGDHNIAVILVESGLATVIRSGEDRPADYEVLLMAEKKASDAKKGVHTPPEKVPSRRLNDLCVDNDPEKRAAQIARTKPFLASFERAGPMKAIVDYVFSGARFKVTIPKQSAVFMFALSGIRVPKRDEGKDGEELSNAALNFSREKLHQLEVTIEVDGLDKGGNFVGTLYHPGKKNFAVALLENGFAYIHYASAERLKEFKELQTAEESAKNKKLGYWKNYDEEAEKAKLAATAAESGDIGPLTGKTVEVFVTEVVDGARMHIQIVGPESAGLDELVNQLTELSVSEGSLPPVTPKVGDLVRGQFTDDDRWYRAKVTEINGDKYKLLYIDYGNSEYVPASRIRTLPANSDLKALPAQAQSAALAFVKPLKEDSDNAKEAKELLRDLAQGKKLSATIEYKDSSAIHLTLVDPVDNLNIAHEMVQQGCARLERSRRRHLSNPVYATLREAEDKAKQRRIGIWYYGDIPDSDEDEREAPRKGAPAGKGASKDAKGAPAAPSGKKK